MKRASILIAAVAALVILAANAWFFLSRPKEQTLPPVAPEDRSQAAQPSLVPAAGPQQPVPPPPQPRAEEVVQVIEDQSSLANEAKAAFEKKDYRTSLDLCRRLSERNKKALFCAGLSYYKLGDYPQAIRFLEEGLEKAGGDAIAHKFLAFAYHHKDDPEKSMLHADKGLALQNDPELEAFRDRLLKERNAHRNYVGEGTLHFTVQFDGYEHGGISRTVLSALEDAHASVGSSLSYYPPEKITVILYTSHDFYDVTQAPGWSGGIFDRRDGKIRMPVRGAERQQALLKTVLSHEYVHALIHSITREAPWWLHEGMAEYFSKGPMQKVGQVIPLTMLENPSGGIPVGLAYAESHSAVSYLIDKYSAYRMRGLLESLGKGNTIDRAFQDAFSMRYAEFVETWGRK